MYLKFVYECHTANLFENINYFSEAMVHSYVTVTAGDIIVMMEMSCGVLQLSE